MRPTIPLAHWRLAIDLDATRHLGAVQTPPTRGCDCDDCTRWATEYVEVLPEALREQLARVGADAARPSDVYTSHHDGSGRGIHVTWHVVGRIVEGPAAFTLIDGLPSVNYVRIDGGDWSLGLAVSYVHHTGWPHWVNRDLRSLVAIELSAWRTHATA